MRSFKNWKSLNENLKDSSYVMNIQKQLLELGYKLPKYGADGKYGQETKSAVRDLQSDLMSKGYKLPKYGADGMWGSETELALKEFKKKKPSKKLADPNTKEVKPKEVTLEGGVKHTYSGNAAKNIDVIIKAGKELGITNPNSIIGVLSIVGKESGFIPQGEASYANTSNERIRKIFTAAKKYTDGELSKIKKNTDKFWEAMYGKDTSVGKKLGNTKKGDGGKYKGRGFNQLTGRANYKNIGNKIGEDLIGNPELVNRLDIASKALFAYLKDGLSRRKIDINGFKSTDDAIKNIARINAGWGNDYGSKVVKYAIAKASEVESNFNVA